MYALLCTITGSRLVTVINVFASGLLVYMQGSHHTYNMVCQSMRISYGRLTHLAGTCFQLDDWGC